MAPVRLTVTPENRATRVALDARARVVADAGRLREVRVSGAGGRRLAGRLAEDGRSWVSTGALAPATRYRVVADAVDDAGTATRRQTTFTTLRPRAELRASVMPLDGETVGVGLPIGVWFNEPVADRAAVERRLQVASSKPVTGAWHWFADDEVHYRPKGVLAERVQGHLPGPAGRRRRRPRGVGRGRPTTASRVGERRVSVVDVRTHRMRVTAGGRTLRMLPVSTGRERYPTTNGVHFVLEKHPGEADGLLDHRHPQRGAPGAATTSGSPGRYGSPTRASSSTPPPGPTLPGLGPTSPTAASTSPPPTRPGSSA